MIKSKYITEDKYEFFIINFKQYIPLFYLMSNYNKYNLILSNESKSDIDELHHILTNNNHNPKFNFNENLTIYYCNQNQLQLINKCNFNVLELNDEINKILNSNDYNPNVVDRPSWAFDNHTLFFDYYKDENVHIFIIEGFEHHWHIIPYLKNHHKVFVVWPCKFGIWNYQIVRNTLHTLNKDFDIKNIIFQCPNLDGILWAHEYGFNAILCNHNCWLDFNKFKTIKNDKIYDMVMNCRQEKNFKRPYLAKKINNLAYIKGAIYNNWDKYDYTELNPKFINENIISMDKVIDIYSQSYCGGIFSAKEGACYSSSEYLLCGLPVISTDSLGGRDFWYDDYNSIIVEPDENEVKLAVEKIIKKYNDGLIDNEKIRNDHIKLSLDQRKNFNDYIQQIFDEYNININAYQYFDTKYIHKMKHNLPINQVIDILTN